MAWNSGIIKWYLNLSTDKGIPLGGKRGTEWDTVKILSFAFVIFFISQIVIRVLCLLCWTELPIWRHHPLKVTGFPISLPLLFPTCGKRNNGLSKMRCLNPGNVWLCTLHAKRDVQMWLRLRTLRWTIYPGYPRWAWSNHTVLTGRREWQKIVAKKCDARSTIPAFIGFEGGWEWPSAKSQQRN